MIQSKIVLNPASIRKVIENQSVFKYIKGIVDCCDKKVPCDMKEYDFIGIKSVKFSGFVPEDLKMFCLISGGYYVCCKDFEYLLTLFKKEVCRIERKKQRIRKLEVGNFLKINSRFVLNFLHNLSFENKFKIIFKSGRTCFLEVPGDLMSSLQYFLSEEAVEFIVDEVSYPFNKNGVTEIQKTLS